MKNIILLASLIPTLALAAPNPATPAPTPPPPPVPDAKLMPQLCTPHGEPVFELDVKPIFDRENGFPTSEAKLFPNGVWSIVEHDKGAITREAVGCIDPRLIGAVTTMLDAAPWKVEHNQIHCEVASFSKTEIKVRGKVVFTQIMCGDDRLDDISAAHLADAEAFLHALTAAPATPPCCKH